MRFDIITIFPEMFPCYFDNSILGKAQEKRKIRIYVHDLRNYARGSHKMTDDLAYGGISGMVMKVEPIYYAVKDIKSKNRKSNPAKLCRGVRKSRIILLSAKGKTFTQKHVRELARYEQLILIAGHYKGVDERVVDYIADEELSIGDFVITGGELPAMVVVDAVSRMIPGVIGKERSKEGESFSSGVRHEHPVYTRPEIFSPKKSLKWQVPKVLLSGNHKEIAAWRKAHRREVSGEC